MRVPPDESGVQAEGGLRARWGGRVGGRGEPWAPAVRAPALPASWLRTEAATPVHPRRPSCVGRGLPHTPGDA